MAPVSRPRSPYGNDSRRTTSTTCSEPRSPSATVVRLARVVAGYGLIGSIRMSSRAVISSCDVARDDLERLAHLGRDRVADLRRVGDVVEVAATRVGERLEQVLVEVVADAEGRRRDAAGTELGGMVAELVRVGDPDIGQAVGQQQAAIDAQLGEVAGHLLAAAQPALAEVRAATRLDGPQALDRAPTRLARRGAWTR